MNEVRTFPMDAERYLLDTSWCDSKTDCAHFRLILTYYALGRPMRDNIEEIRRIAKLDLTDYVRVKGELERLGWYVEAGEWRHKRIEKVLESIKKKELSEVQEKDAKRQQTAAARAAASVTRSVTEAATDLLHYLNEKSGRNFRETDTNLGFICARLREDGVDAIGIKKMVDRQISLWKGDAVMSEYLRPETLFNKTKFDSYYAAKDLPLPGQAAAKERPAHWPQRTEVIEYVKQKGDGLDALAVQLYEWFKKNDFKRNGKTIDWKIVASEQIAKRRTPE